MRKALAVGLLSASVAMFSAPAMACRAGDTACFQAFQNLQQTNQAIQQQFQNNAVTACKIGCIENNNDYDAQVQCKQACAQGGD